MKYTNTATDLTNTNEDGTDEYWKCSNTKKDWQRLSQIHIKNKKQEVCFELPNYISIRISNIFLYVYRIYFYWYHTYFYECVKIYFQYKINQIRFGHVAYIWLTASVGKWAAKLYFSSFSKPEPLPLWHIQIFPSSWISIYIKTYAQNFIFKNINWELTFQGTFKLDFCDTMQFYRN